MLYYFEKAHSLPIGSSQVQQQKNLPGWLLRAESFYHHRRRHKHLYTQCWCWWWRLQLSPSFSLRADHLFGLPLMRDQLLINKYTYLCSLNCCYSSSFFFFYSLSLSPSRVITLSFFSHHLLSQVFKKQKTKENQLQCCHVPNKDLLRHPSHRRICCLVRGLFLSCPK